MKMKKSIFAILLATVLLFCSCDFGLGESGETTVNPSTSERATEESEETVVESDLTETDPPVPDTGYLEIDRVEPKGYTTSCFAIKGSELGLSLRLPGDWRFDKQSRSIFNIYSDGRQIGRIVFGADDNDGSWEELSSEAETSGSLDIKISIEKSVSSGAYRHLICFAFSEDGELNKITLEVDYRELSETAITMIKLYAQCKSVGSDPQLGIIDIEKSNSNRVLIMGNSFIGSSRVGSILQEMMSLNGKNTVVDHISRGYAHVDTYAYDEIIMDEIKSGAYGAVFICGFYSNDQAEHLAVLKKACDASGTALFMFPAHNEQAASIKFANKKVSGVYLLNWKEEVQSFIDNGGNKWDFCIDDQHLHSTPLAGYIGAHMIYRAIHGEIPRGALNQSISQAEVNRVLGDYPKTGITYGAGSSDLYFFEK